MADVNQTIQDFYTAAQARDFSRDNLFRVLNINFGNTTQVINQEDLVYAKTASLPAKEITSKAVPYMGLNFNVPGVAQYPNSDGYAITFYCDAAQVIRQKFLGVVNDTFNDATSTGNYFIPKQNAVIDLIQLDKQLNKIAQYQLVGVAIKSVGELTYNITSTGEIQEFTVTITYHYFNKTG